MFGIKMFLALMCEDLVQVSRVQNDTGVLFGALAAMEAARKPENETRCSRRARCRRAGTHESEFKADLIISNMLRWRFEA